MIVPIPSEYDAINDEHDSNYSEYDAINDEHDSTYSEYDVMMTCVML
jgi:hypothetical protein